MPPILPLIGAGLGLVGGIIGRVASSGDRKRSEAAAKQSFDAYSGLAPPKLSPVSFSRVSAPSVSAPRASAAQGRAYTAPMSSLVRAGTIVPGAMVNPLMISAGTINAPQLSAPNRLGTAFDMIRENPELKLAQMEALGLFREMSKEGLTAEDLAALHEIYSREQAEFRAQREGIEGQMARRGILGSGMELASKLQSAQDASQIAHDQSTDVAAMNQAARREGLSRYTDLAGQMMEQDYMQQRDRAVATDDMGRFNEENIQRVNLSNADFKLRAALANADNALRASMSNQDARLQSDIFNSDTTTRVNTANVGNKLNADMANQDMQTQINTTNAGLRTQVSMGNAQMRTSVSQGNAEMSLRAKLANASNKLNASQFNSTGQFNAAMANREATTWEWAQTIGMADRKAANSQNQSQFYRQKAADTGGFWSNIGAGVGGILGLATGGK